MDRLNAEEYWLIFFTFGSFITFVSINAFVASTLPDLLLLMQQLFSYSIFRVLRMLSTKSQATSCHC